MKTFPSKFGLAFVILMLVFCGKASAENWRAFRSDDNRSHYFDLDSILPISKTVVRVWVQVVYTPAGVAEEVRQFGLNYENLKSQKALWEVNCSEKKMRMISLFRYSQNGTVLYSHQDDTTEWKFHPPGTIAAILRETVCGVLDESQFKEF